MAQHARSSPPGALQLRLAARRQPGLCCRGEGRVACVRCGIGSQPQGPRHPPDWHPALMTTPIVGPRPSPRSSTGWCPMRGAWPTPTTPLPWSPACWVSPAAGSLPAAGTHACCLEPASCFHAFYQRSWHSCRAARTTAGIPSIFTPAAQGTATSDTRRSWARMACWSCHVSVGSHQDA